MRRKSITEIPETFVRDPNRRVQETFHFQLITPMFGGDVESWKLNEKEPVRSQSIKGQLRFWWRTMQNETDVNILLKEENRLWGGKSGENRTKSSVEIAVTEQKASSVSVVPSVNKNGARNGLGNNILSNYVLFPITENIVKKNDAIKLIKPGAEFTLLVSFNPEDRETVLDTLKLWALFGGVGARTRRGCGSVYSPELLGEFKEPRHITSFLQAFQRKNAPQTEYPRLSGSHFYSKPGIDIKMLLEAYGKYRQMRRAGSNPRSGRSYWPEPDAIRNITGQSSATHRAPINNENWFPRSAFGLPILTKFGTNGDPSFGSNIELKPRGGERWPSPMILKNVKLGDKTFSIMLVLNHLFPKGLLLGTREVPQNAKPTNTQNRRMIVKDDEPRLSLNGRSIYKALADHLRMEEIQ